MLGNPTRYISIPLGLGELWGRCPGVGFTALRQPRAEIRNSVGVEGASSPMGIRISAQGCRPALRSSEARRREQGGGYPGKYAFRTSQPQRGCVRPGINPRRISRPEILNRGGKEGGAFRGIHRVDQDSRQGLRHEISGGYSGPDATPLGLGELWGRCPGVGFTALRQPRA